MEVTTDGDSEAPDPVISSGINFRNFDDTSEINSDPTAEPAVVYWRLAGIGPSGEIKKDSKIVSAFLRPAPTVREGHLPTDQGASAATGPGVKRKREEENKECKHCNKEHNTINIDA